MAVVSWYSCEHDQTVREPWAYSVISSSLLSSTRRRFFGGLGLLMIIMNGMRSQGNMQTYDLPLSLVGGSDPGGFIFETTSSLKVNHESCLSELSVPPLSFGQGTYVASNTMAS